MQYANWPSKLVVYVVWLLFTPVFSGYPEDESIQPFSPKFGYNQWTDFDWTWNNNSEPTHTLEYLCNSPLGTRRARYYFYSSLSHLKKSQLQGHIFFWPTELCLLIHKFFIIFCGSRYDCNTQWYSRSYEDKSLTLLIFIVYLNLWYH